jgi:hypothetical protein
MPKAGQETGKLAPPWLVIAHIAVIKLGLGILRELLPPVLEFEFFNSPANWDEPVGRLLLQSHCFRNCHRPGDILGIHAACDAGAQDSPCAVDYRELVRNQTASRRLASHRSDVGPWVGAWVAAWLVGEGAEIAHPVDRESFVGR